MTGQDRGAGLLSDLEAVYVVDGDAVERVAIANRQSALLGAARVDERGGVRGRNVTETIFNDERRPPLRDRGGALLAVQATGGESGAVADRADGRAEYSCHLAGDHVVVNG